MITFFEQMELQSGRCTRQGNARGTTDYSESESAVLSMVLVAIISFGGHS